MRGKEGIELAQQANRFLTKYLTGLTRDLKHEDCSSSYQVTFSIQILVVIGMIKHACYKI